MKDPCTVFRRALSNALSAHGEATLNLGWHEHLLGCSACRELLQAEEALDALLASLPEPELPRDLAQRVLVRLREETLETLLEFDREPRIPAGLSERVLGSVRVLRDSSDARLDALLDRLPEPAIPTGLASNVLARIAAERQPVQPLRSVSPWMSELPRSVALVAAAALVVAWAWFAWLRPETAPVDQDATNAIPLIAEEGSGDHSAGDGFDDVDPELLASLDLLEDWDTLMSDDVELVLYELNELEATLFEFGVAREEGG